MGQRNKDDDQNNEVENYDDDDNEVENENDLITVLRTIRGRSPSPSTRPRRKIRNKRNGKRHSRFSLEKEVSSFVSQEVARFI